MNNNFAHAHGTVMISAWMIFGSTGVLFARYGRVLRVGNQRQFLGKSIWFQTHRFLLSLSSLLILLGFFLIIIYRRGQWVSVAINGPLLFTHSIVGSIIVCCIILQIWLALYRCNPHSPFRFIFNWTHRITGSLAFGFSFINLFLITFVLKQQHIALLIIVSLWTSWMIIIVIFFELIQYQYRKVSALMARNARVSYTNQEGVNANVQPDTEAGTNPTIENQRLNKVKLFLFLIHIIISIVLSIPLIIIIWNQS
ncbi:unnamed protein product [Adineta steineri]|uniref:Cytochrome b561 domain-containing protein n=1 Tax=Adineta steineri TaxID=433720 RepID=A0A814K187_9BILA|nr:unnamed protein product [Adineta steineri]CAF1119789.1 unnamed protein product [Adineta steineri]